MANNHVHELAAEYWPGLTPEIFDELAEDYALLQLEWEDMVGEHEDDMRRVRRYYEEGFGMLLDRLRSVVSANEWGPEEDRGNIITRHCQAADCRWVLEYGGGTGGTALFLARQGFQVGFTEMGETLKFARWRFEREGRLHNRFRADMGGSILVFSRSEVALSGLFTEPWDAISAIDVLEHIPNPLRVVQQMRDVLRPNGLLIITRHSFKQHPTHLKANEWLLQDIETEFDKLGFDRWGEPDGHYGIGAWRKRP